MIDYWKQIVIGQFEAALAMMKQCVSACPDELWEDKIANGTIRWVTYHTLFFVDYYLTADETLFELNRFSMEGGDERGSEASEGLPREETLEYLLYCRQKTVDTITDETQSTLEGPSGFSWCRFTRGELHLYSLRHVQHHTGQLSAYLRRHVPECADRRALPWVHTGWR
jgi:uncharacterized damage-inducible protein DinB